MSDTGALITTVRGHNFDIDMPFLKSMSLKSHWEDKDYKFEKAMFPKVGGTLELSQPHVIPEFTPISQQGRAGTCVANAWCDCVEMLIGMHYGKSNVVQLSRRFAYWVSRYLHSATDRDDGTFLRAMGHQFLKVGVVLEEDMPYSDQERDLVGKAASPELQHYTMASNNRIKSFYRLSSMEAQMLREMEVAVRSNHPVVIGVPVTGYFQDERDLAIFTRPADADVIGRHCMLVVGVRFESGKRQWLIRNSWGKNWGDNGHCWMTDDYLSLSTDTWVGSLKEQII